MRRNLRGVAAVAALFFVLAMTGCGGSTAPTGGSSSGPAASTVQVVLAGIAIQPTQATVAVGGTVTWVNNDSVMHNLTDDKGAWASGQMAPGKSFSQKFTTAGTFPYHCIIHPSMTGTIIVK